ncbi:MAG: ATP synthase F1 subunit delta [Coriobacteriia bacterium]
MPISRVLAKQIVSTYATALYEAAANAGVVDKVDIQLDAVVRIARSSAPLRDLLLDESVSPEKRVETVQRVFAGLERAVVSTLAVLAERGDFGLLTRVVEEYGQVAEKKRDIVAVDVTTAVELNEQLRNAIVARLGSDLGKGVVLREKVDPTLIGGIVLEANGKRIDASIASQLESARKVLSTVSTGGER